MCTRNPPPGGPGLVKLQERELSTNCDHKRLETFSQTEIQDEDRLNRASGLNVTPKTDRLDIMYKIKTILFFQLPLFRNVNATKIAEWFFSEAQTGVVFANIKLQITKHVVVHYEAAPGTALC